MCSLRLAYCLFTFFMVGAVTHVACLRLLSPCSPTAPHITSHTPNTPPSIHFLRTLEELLGFFFCRRCNTPRNCQNLLSSFPAEPTAMGSSSSTHLSHPLLRRSHLWPHFSLCNNTYNTYIQKMTQHSWLSFLWHNHPVLHLFWVNFVTRYCWCCLSSEESLSSEVGFLLLIQSPYLRRFSIGWYVVGAHSDAELLTVSSI